MSGVKPSDKARARAQTQGTQVKSPVQDHVQGKTPPQSQVQVRVGSDAIAEIDDAGFIQAWKQLYQRCSWATAGQNPEFLAIWYRLYASTHTPILVYQWAEVQGELTGLLALCRTNEGLCHAASEDCEYHAWLALENISSSFMPRALDALSMNLGPLPIHLNYLPPDTPLQWLGRSSAAALRCELGQSDRRVLPVHDADFVKKYIKDKSRLRTTMNKFKRTATIRFRRVTDPDDAVAVIRACQPLFDFRKGALYGVLPFRDEARRAELLMAQAKIPGLLHISVLERDEEVVAAHIGTSGKKELSIAGLVHSEFYSRYSPGSLLLVELISLLHQEGYAFLDFTPGGDEYKARFAKEVEPVYSLHVYPTRLAREAKRLRKILKETAKSSLERLPENMQGRLRSIRSQVNHRLRGGLFGSGNAGGAENPSHGADVDTKPQLQMFCWQEPKAPITSQSPANDRFWQINSIRDVLQYPANRGDFMALLRLAFHLARAGAQMYTHCESDSLQSIYFLVPAQGFASSDQLQKNDWILWGIDSRPASSGSSLGSSPGGNAVSARLELVDLARTFVKEQRLLLALSESQWSGASSWENLGFQRVLELDGQGQYFLPNSLVL